jgi:hypothetical protein
LVAIYLGQTEEERINCMSYRFFNKILDQLNRVLKYDAAVGFAGNGFFKDSYKYVDESNPLTKDKHADNKSFGESMAAFINGGNVTVKAVKKGEDKDGFVLGKAD